MAKPKLLPTNWIMRTKGGWYPIQPSDRCKPEDHGKLNDHVVAIEDASGKVLWRRSVQLCRDCDLVHPDTRSHSPYRWRCMAHPAEPFGGFVDPDWRPDPPYHECKRVNTDGECPDWTPRRMPKEASDD